MSNFACIDLAIDPGKHGCGLAAWGVEYPPKTLFLGAEYAPELSSFQDTKHLLLRSAQGLVDRVHVIHTLHSAPIRKVFLERPKHYPTAQQKGDQEDISELSIVVGTIVRSLAEYAQEIVLLYPHEWKGQAPKEVTTARAKKALTPEEIGRIILPKQKTLQHNVYDAVALGLSQIR